MNVCASSEMLAILSSGKKNHMLRPHCAQVAVGFNILSRKSVR